MMKNGILTFIFAFCPGAGQMYQGYMKRGLSLITMFCLFVVIGVSTLQVLTIGRAIVWMYSFFDTFNLRAQIGAGTAPEDDYLVHINWHDQRMEQFMLDSHTMGMATYKTSSRVLAPKATQNIVISERPRFM